MPKYKIFIGSGAWYVNYYMGLFHYIFTTYGTQSFRDVIFEGVSAGAQVAGCCVATIYGCHDMKYWMECGPKRIIRDNTYSFGSLTSGFYNVGCSLYDELNDEQRHAMKTLFSALCIDHELKPYYCADICDRDELGNAGASTGNIPGIGSHVAWQFRDKYLWDGGINQLVNYNYYHDIKSNIDNLLIISLSESKDGTNVLDLSQFINSNLLLCILPSLLPSSFALNACDFLFERGYNDAANNKDIIRQKLLPFLSR